ncbi:MFS transporter [Streptomyces sp. NBC_00335]|uniref:MFS transporter n=1 Tax=unclassified Streptomyces TaxID=2593676 RepID=UPI002254DDDD|nr:MULTISPECIES: MFS transporter [unclassified Streptomyces]MCX5402630.1 MFS transporter [Streptomyces sp. NBC_00086]
MTVTQTEHTAHTTQTTGTTKALTASGPKAARPASGPAFALLGTVQMTLIFALTSLIVPLPAIGREFTLGRDDLMLLSAAYGLSFAGLLLFGGRLTDRFGGRRVLTAGLLLFAVASLAAPFAQGSGTLLTARFAQGVGAALTAPAAMAVLRAVFPEPAAFGRAMATWGGLSVLGATAGNLLSGVISALTTWRLSFAVPVVVAVAALLLAPRLLPVTPAGEGRSLDLPGALLATAGISLASYGFVLTDVQSWGSTGVLVTLLTAAVLLLAFPLVERRVRDPLLPLGFLRDRRRVLALAAIGLTAAGTAVTFVLLSLHLQQELGWSALSTSAAFLPFAVALLVAGRVAGPLVARYGAPRVTTAGLVVAAAGLALLALTGLAAEIPYAYGLLPGLLLLPAGTAAAFAGAAVLATDGVEPHQAGLAGGVMNTAMELGPTVVFAAVLSLGSDTVSLAATAVAFAAAGFLNTRIK